MTAHNYNKLQQLRQLHEALSDLKAALVALKNDVSNRRNLAVMSEGTQDEIARIESEIAEYTERKKS